MLHFYIFITAVLIAGILVLLRHMALLKKELGRVRESERRKASMCETAALLASCLDIASLREAILEEAKKLTGAQLSAIVTSGADGAIKMFRSGGPSSAGAEAELPGTAGILKFALERKAPFRAGADMLAGNWAPEDWSSFWVYPVKNVMIAPALVQDEAVGAIMAANKDGGFTERDESALLALGYQGALAIKKAQFCERVHELAVKDGLTGLHNYRAFQEKLDFEMERARRFNQHLGLLMLDVDNFKMFNDTFGHKAGDEALKTIAATMTEAIRYVDFAARYGGEEFAVILVESTPESALMAAERIRQAVEQSQFNMGGGFRLTISIGVASFPLDAMDKETLIQEADSALYMSKRLGKNMVSMASTLSNV